MCFVIVLVSSTSNRPYAQKNDETRKSQILRGKHKYKIMLLKKIWHYGRVDPVFGVRTISTAYTREPNDRTGRKFQTLVILYTLYTPFKRTFSLILERAFKKIINTCKKCCELWPHTPFYYAATRNIRSKFI